MSHENSTTKRVKFPRLGERYVVMSESGKTLGPRRGFNTMTEANQYAKARSDAYGRGKRKQPTSR